MNIAEIIISLLLTILPVVVLIRDLKYHDKRTKKHHAITITVIIIWFVSSIAATFFVWSDARQIDDLIDGKNILLDQNGELSTKVDQYQEKLEMRSDKNIKLSEENIKLNKEVSSWVTGGDASCFIFPMIDSISDRQTLQLFHQGNNPLFDVGISIENRSIDMPIKELYDEIIKSHSEDLAHSREKQRDLSSEMDNLLNSRIERISIGTLPPNTTIPLIRLKLPHNEKQEFFIKISTRNGYFTQIIKQQKANGIWQSTWQLLKHETNGEKREVRTFIGPQFDYKE